MTTATHLMLISVLALSACTTAEVRSSGTATTDDTAGAAADDSSPGRTSSVAFTHKMMKTIDGKMGASLAYECPECSFAQHKAIVPPEGWQKGPTQVSAFSSATMRSTPKLEGVEEAVDFIAEVPGKEYKLIAKNLSATLVGSTPTGLFVKAQVMRDTLFRYAAGTRIHELTDPDGAVFVLFAHAVDPDNVVIPDFQDDQVLQPFEAPEGWSYSTRVLDTELLMDIAEVATVLAVRGKIDSTWQQR